MPKTLDKQWGECSSGFVPDVISPTLSMNPDRACLLAALDAWLDATHDSDAAKRRFDTKVDDLLIDKPWIDRQRFVLALMTMRKRIHRQEAKQPSALPPDA